MAQEPVMEAFATILDLPAELQLQIAVLLDKDSLLAIRVTHPELCGNFHEEFARQFFTVRRHATTKYSLEALRNITATPALVRYIERVELVAVGTDLEYELPASPAQTPPARHCVDMPGAYPFEERWCRDVDDAARWETINVLEKIFENLAIERTGRVLHLYRLGWKIKIAERDTSSNEFRNAHGHTFGVASYVRSVNAWMTVTRVNGSGPVDVTQAVFRALQKSGYQPTELRTEIGCTREQEVNFQDCDTFLQRNLISHACMHLKVITIDIDISLLDDEYVPAAIQKIVHFAGRLERLSVSGLGSDVEREVLDHIKTTYDTFKSLRMTENLVPKPQFMWLPSFMMRNLRHLEIGDMDIMNGEWRRVFRTLLECPKLQTLSLYDLGSDDQSLVWEDRSGTRRWKAESSANVRNLLKSLIDGGGLQPL